MALKDKPLQRRGQLTTHEGLPVDSVGFLTTNGLEAVCLQTDADPTHITVTWRKSEVSGRVGEFRTETFKTLAFAMRRFANILEGKVTFEEFATQPSQKPVVVKV